MKPSEVALLLASAAAFDRREPSETDAMAWHRVFAAAGLDDLTLLDANQALTDHYGQTRDWLMPYDIVRRCKAVRRERIRALNASGVLERLVCADPAEELRERQRITRDVAAGHRVVGELETGR